MFRTAGLLAAVFFLFGVLVTQLLGVPMGLIVIESGSMEPTVERGDAVVAVPDFLVEREYGPGDVIVFDDVTLTESGPTTHRIVEETETGYVTQGDNNPVTDQAGREPVVTRNRVLGYVPEPGGDPVVIPFVGSAVLFVQESALGQPVRLVGLGVGLVVLGLVSSFFESRRYDREKTDRSGLRPLLLIPLVVTAVVVIATAAMTLPSGPTAIGIQAVSETPEENGTYRTGQEAEITYRHDNAGLTPVLVVIESEGDIADPPDDGIYVGPRAEATRNVSVDVPSEPGNHQLALSEHRYLLVLPPGTIIALHEIAPIVALAAVNAVIAVVTTLLLLLFLGTTPIRTRSRSSSAPARVRIRRWLDAVRGRG